MQSYTHFTLEERENLRILLAQGRSMREIARQLGRNVSSISREIARNTGRRGYNAWGATSRYLQRRKKCRRKLRLEEDTDLCRYVEQSLLRYWSPEIIVAKWKQSHPDARLSHTTLYRAIYSGLLPDYPAKKYLRRRGLVKYTRRKNSHTIRPHRLFSERPWEAQNRTRIGDWEGDTMHGGRGKGCLVTCIDRKTRYLTAAISNGFSAKEVAAKLIRALTGKPRHTLTLDRGSEFALFREIEHTAKLKIYFADPHAPWQRGSNENINDALRFFFPKGCDFRSVKPTELQHVVDLINQRPRKCLNWLSPADIFNSCCS